jgi:predicted secreted protein
MKLGMDAKLYLLTSGTRAAWPGTGAPTNLTLVDNVKDVALNLSTAEADVTTRANNGWKASVSTLKEGSVDFDMICNTSDANFAALQSAFFNRTSVAIAVLDGDKATVGTQGLWADFSIMNFSRDEKLTEAQSVKVSLKPTISSSISQPP